MPDTTNDIYLRILSVIKSEANICWLWIFDYDFVDTWAGY